MNNRASDSWDMSKGRACLGGSRCEKNNNIPCIRAPGPACLACWSAPRTVGGNPASLMTDSSPGEQWAEAKEPTWQEMFYESEPEYN